MKPLSMILDKKNFKKLVAECGGKRVWVPKYGNIGSHDKEYFKIRNEVIRSFKSQGLEIDKLAKRFDLSIKSIYNITKERRPAPKKNGLNNVSDNAEKNDTDNGAKNSTNGTYQKYITTTFR